MNDTLRLKPEQCHRACDPAQFDFKTTDELEPVAQIPGQERAVEAIRFGMGIRKQGYNLYALGPVGIGRHTTIRGYLEELASKQATPPDWVYVNNFQQPHKPIGIELPPGQGLVMQQDMQQLIDDLRSAIPIAFEAEQYHNRIEELEDGFKERAEGAFGELTKEAERHEITLLRTPHGFAFAPLKDGKVLSTQEFQKLPAKEQERLREIIAVLEEQLNGILRQQPQWQREAREKVRELNREVALFAVGHIIDELRKKYQAYAEVIEYLNNVQEDVITNLQQFRGEEEEGMHLFGEREKPSFRRYEVNLLVDNSQTRGAPILYEDNPQYASLVGRIEHKAQLGALITDFTLIKAGALHRANGGYLILDVIKLLTSPFAWEGLKRILFAREISMQTLEQLFSLVSTVSLEPEAIPLDIKIVLIGDRRLYYLLYAYDPEFAELFKVAADFEDRIDCNEENHQLYARLIATIARREELLPFQREAVARVIEHSARMVEDSQKLSTHVLSIADLLREADFFAREAGQKLIRREDIQTALSAQIRRADRVRDRLYEEIRRGTLLIDIDGEKVAQVNGLSVMDLGNFAFGAPSRITATARLGEGEVVDIEREVEMGGPIHSKGVFILSSFLAARYASDKPLSLSASLAFEQNYGGIEGDSASMAELCALLSALAETPIKQSLAITGSVNQLGQAQAIGGVNEKVEGFFDICNSKTLTGTQGVLIPQSNVQHLMLREDVVKAVAANKFHLYAYRNVDEAISLLTGIAAGELDSDGNYPEDSINYLVAARLDELEQIREQHKAAIRELEHEHDAQLEKDKDTDIT